MSVQDPEKQDMERLRLWMRQHAITEVECLLPDFTGNARGKILPADKFLKERGMRLPDNIFLQTVNGDWPDDGSIDWTEQDMELQADIRTPRLVPWASEPTAQVIHDCFDSHGQPVEMAPRNVLRRVLKLYEEKGWQPVVAPELEFFLVKKNEDWDYPLEPPIGRNGRPETARQSYSIDAVNEFDPIFEDMYDYCEAQELDVDSLIHESGAAQMEVNFIHGDALELADQVFLFKRTMREAAMRHNVYATFMAKPMKNEPGSSMHIHQSLVDQDGNNLFANPDGSHSKLFLHYIGGMQHYVPAAVALFAPNVNSYRRLAFGDSAPRNMSWGEDNRTVGLRVPRSGGSDRRIENRYPGADANPYLALAASLACGYLGMVQGIEATAPIQGSAYNMPFGLARSLEEALLALDQSADLRDILGQRFVDAFIAVKRQEYEAFFTVISAWEREFLLLNV